MSIFSPTISFENVFTSPQTLATRKRVSGYLRRTFQLFTNFSEEDIAKNFVSSLFVFDLPTETAYLSEEALIKAIAAHSTGHFDDDQIKQCLKSFTDSHTILLSNERLKVKVGSGQIMKQSNLTYLRCGESDRLAFVCNPLQKLIIKMTFGEIFTVTNL